MKYLMKNYGCYRKDAAVEIIDQFPSMVKTLSELFRKRLKKKIQHWFRKTQPKKHNNTDVLLDQDYLDGTPIILKNSSKC